MIEHIIEWRVVVLMCSVVVFVTLCECSVKRRRSGVMFLVGVCVFFFFFSIILYFHLTIFLRANYLTGEREGHVGAQFFYSV